MFLSLSRSSMGLRLSPSTAFIRRAHKNKGSNPFKRLMMSNQQRHQSSQPTPLPPLAERIHPNFLRALHEWADAKTIALLETNESLVPALQRLDHIPVRLNNGYSTTALCRIAQQAFPRASTATSLCVPQYKKRSVQTLVRNLKRFDQLSWSTTPSPEVVLLGDSMLERLSRQHILQPSNHRVFNLAVGGDGVEHTLCQLELAHRTYLTQVPTFVLMTGINNVMGTRRGNESQSTAASAALIVEGIANLVRFLLDNSKRTTPPKIYLCQLLHIYGNSNNDLDPRVVNPIVDQVNQSLQWTIHNPNCQLVPTVMPRDPIHYNEDGVHLSHAGYHTLMAQLPDFVQNHIRPHVFLGSRYS